MLRNKTNWNAIRWFVVAFPMLWTVCCWNLISADMCQMEVISRGCTCDNKSIHIESNDLFRMSLSILTAHCRTKLLAKAYTRKKPTSFQRNRRYRKPMALNKCTYKTIHTYIHTGKCGVQLRSISCILCMLFSAFRNPRNMPSRSQQ